MPEQLSCPTVETWRQLAFGLASELDMPAMLAHLGSCDSCRSRLERLIEEDFTPANADANYHSARRRLLDAIEASRKDSAHPNLQSTAGGSTSPYSEKSAMGGLVEDDRVLEVGPYAIDGKIGEGGMGVVLRG